MSGETPVRRSRRGRVPSKKYTVDAFEGLNVFDTSDEENEHHELRQQIEAQEDDDTDGDFYVEKEAGVEADEDDEEGTASVFAASDDSQVLTPNGGEDGKGILFPEDAPHEQIKRTNTTKVSGTLGAGTWRWKADAPYADRRTRGLNSGVSKGNRGRYLVEMYGEEMFETIAKAIEKFITDLTFPTRNATNGHGGMAYPVGFNEGIKIRGQTTTKPYFPTRFVTAHTPSSQVASILPRDKGAHYLPKVPSALQMLAGPYHSQRMYSLLILESVALDDIFEAQQSDALPLNRTTENVKRKGRIINVGGRVAAMSWAPSRAGASQYLAVAVRQKPPPMHRSHTPFTPSQPYPASIQIWKFSNKRPKGGRDPNEMWRTPPQLVHVICTEWGGVRKLEWCPAIWEHSEESLNDFVVVGRLAGIWTDGCVRVLDVRIPTTNESIFTHYTSAIFTARPPESVCTSIAWPSPDDLAAGCANGFVAMWNLPKALQITPSQATIDPHALQPYFYHPFSETYILDLVSSAPIVSHHLMSLSVSGFQRLTDLRNPTLEYVVGLRTRLYAASGAYSPHIQAYFTADEQGELGAQFVRRFFGVRRAAPTTGGSAGGIIIATSPVHCSVLTGAPDGIVACTNPVRRLVDSRTLNAWSQKWFVHEWRRAQDDRMRTQVENDVGKETAEERNDTQKEELDQQLGIIRITEGYKAEQVGNLDKTSRSKSTIVLYEEEQAITALEWNPNLDCGGWAAAGMGSGLVRVEDVAV